MAATAHNSAPSNKNKRKENALFKRGKTKHKSNQTIPFIHEYLYLQVYLRCASFQPTQCFYKVGWVDFENFENTYPIREG